VYTFDDCIEMCAAYNVYSGGSTTCEMAVYDVKGSRPVNCIVGSAQTAAAENIGIDGSLAIALLKSSA